MSLPSGTPRRLRYQPRRWFIPYHSRSQRWAMVVAHRRAGKTVATIGDMVERALHNPLPRPQYGYIAPLYNQAKKIAWNYLKDMTVDLVARPPLESSLSVELLNGATISLFGADNPDSFRGVYFDGVILDEYGNMSPSTWTKVLMPTLVDRQGWATFIGTPNGPNHFRDQWLKALKDPARYYTRMLPVTETKLIPEAELEEMRLEMPEEDYQQEMLCSFEAATRGAFFGKEIAQAEADGRVLDLMADATMPMDFVFDLGYEDSTAMWLFQQRPDGMAIHFSESDNRRDISYYIKRIHQLCQQFNCPRGKIWLPHDARAKTLQTGRSIVEQFMAAGIRPQIVPSLSFVDGIAAARMMLPLCYFDKIGCEEGLLALKSYHRKFDEQKKTYVHEAVHDWSSHYADGFRYLALIASPMAKPKPPPEKLKPPTTPMMHEYTLDKLYAAQIDLSRGSMFRRI